MKAGHLIDNLEGDQRIKSKNHRIRADVVSLFPSLKRVEAARLARYAVLNSSVSFENFDHYMALRYLTIVGGREMLEKAKTGPPMPKWNGDRQDLIYLGAPS